MHTIYRVKKEINSSVNNIFRIIVYIIIFGRNESPFQINPSKQ
ncbi:hypothetical protein pb186bvf_019032 [Paramecium bursaria]